MRLPYIPQCTIETRNMHHSPHRLFLAQLAGGWPMTAAESPILPVPNILCTGVMEYKPYVSKGIIQVSVRFIIEIHYILCIYMCGHQKIQGVWYNFVD